MIYIFCYFFFFSSRRRHTRFDCDWSSDVCSSDLTPGEIPDQLRAEEFLQELSEYDKSGALPNLLIVTLNADHTNGTRPGSPTPRAMVAEDDLALGRMVEGISKSRFWEQSLILVVEDDAQDVLDHVDGYRTVALAIGPHI